MRSADRGMYDFDYMDYLAAVLELLPLYGMKAYIDPHQDGMLNFRCLHMRES